MDTDAQFKAEMIERFRKLPKVVQQAIVSADVSKHMRELAAEFKLHIDQWETLENEVQYTLLGIETPAKLPENLQKELGVDSTTAAALAASISKNIFEPIRQQLETQLQHADTVAAHDTTIPAPSLAQLAEGTPQAAPIMSPSMQAPAATQTEPPPATVSATPASQETAAIVKSAAAAIQPAVPATPPTAPIGGKVERAPLSTNYAAAQASHERKSIEGDPYREQIA